MTRNSIFLSALTVSYFRFKFHQKPLLRKTENAENFVQNIFSNDNCKFLIYDRNLAPNQSFPCAMEGIKLSCVKSSKALDVTFDCLSLIFKNTWLQSLLTCTSLCGFLKVRIFGFFLFILNCIWISGLK